MAARRESPGQEPLMEIPEAEAERLVKELKKWWADKADFESGQVAPKAVEYGSADLKIMGQAMAMVSGRFGDDIPDRVWIELAIAFYALGKVARLFGAYEQGRLPSDDTWHDLGVYCRMAQRVRESGGWPS